MTKQKVKCPDCGKEFEAELKIEVMTLDSFKSPFTCGLYRSGEEACYECGSWLHGLGGYCKESKGPYGSCDKKNEEYTSR